MFVFFIYCVVVEDINISYHVSFPRNWESRSCHARHVSIHVSTCCQTIEYIPPLQSNSIIEIGARGVTLVSIIIVFRRVVFPRVL